MTDAVLQTEKPPVFDVARYRRDFPILQSRVGGKRLVFLDSAASAQKPRIVLDTERECYEHYYANVHRGVHALSVRSTEAFEEGRETVRRFLNAPSLSEIIFVRGTTEAINLVARSYGGSQLGPGDEVLVTEMEHHSNIVPWQMICAERGARVVKAPIDDRGDLILEEFEAKLNERTKVVAVTHVSNALGTINPIRRIADLAHAVGAVVVVDGAQAAPHLEIDVQALDCDFYAMSGHKAFGPSGVGALWGRETLLEAMPPYQGGGEMILSVSFDHTEYAGLPHKFEAGTPDIGGAIAMGAALRYLEENGGPAMHAHEAALLESATRKLSERDDIRLIGTSKTKCALVTFVVKGVHAHDVGTILDSEGVAVRTGHHCAQPVMAHFGVPASVRASFAFYNTLEEVDALVRALDKVQEVFAR